MLDEAGEIHIVVRAFASFAGDDQRRTRFVDQNVVNLVDDGVVQFALAEPIKIMHHVVAQIIKAKLVVRAVENVGVIGLGTGNRAQRQKAIIGRWEFGIVDKAALVWADRRCSGSPLRSRPSR